VANWAHNSVPIKRVRKTGITSKTIARCNGKAISERITRSGVKNPIISYTHCGTLFPLSFQSFFCGPVQRKVYATIHPVSPSLLGSIQAEPVFPLLPAYLGQLYDRWLPMQGVFWRNGGGRGFSARVAVNDHFPLHTRQISWRLVFFFLREINDLG